ncbi:hypothetical protein HK405_007482 [Cladochytrium tenue]|nr:hypothetical protein HK405_007482 [Cladochytrium tenue]
MSGAFVVLVTGCTDGGIGCEVARAFASRAPPPGSGCTSVLVFAASRRLDAMRSLAAIPNVVRLVLDVNADDSVALATAEIDRVAGRLDVLVNNAGVSCYGPTVEVPADTLRRILDTNTVAPLALTQALLPLMLRERLIPPATSEPVARVVNVGSVVGSVCTPFNGIYSVSKAALHMLSSALRMELRPLRVSVCTVRPGGIVSNISRNGIASMVFDENRSLYAGLARFVHERATASQSKRSTPTTAMARRIVETALRPGYMPADLTYGHLSTLLTFLSRLPYWLSDWILMWRYGLWPTPRSMITSGAK